METAICFTSFLIDNELQPAQPERRRSGIPVRQGGAKNTPSPEEPLMSDKYVRPTTVFIIPDRGITNLLSITIKAAGLTLFL
jgi:hypothetical protein